MSYDNVEVLTGFAAKYGISYPLLSDDGSRAIRELGILNEEAPEQIAGIPHPGTFVINADGTVRSKHFYPSYRERDTGMGVLEHLLGVEGEGHGVKREADANDEGVAVRGWFDKDSYAWGQRIWLTVELEIAPGLHVYGEPIPEGYAPLHVEVLKLERVVVGEPVYPGTSAFHIAGIDERFAVYEGTTRVSMPIVFMTVDAGSLNVEVVVSYQACSTTECLAPKVVRLVLPISETVLIERPATRA